MKKILSILLISVTLFSCNGDNSSNGDEPTYEEKVLTVEEEEQKDPMRFLSSDGTFRKNLLGEWVIEGTISNNATVAVYKDVVLKFDFYSKTKTLLGSETHTVYEFIEPGQSSEFKIKTYASEIDGKPDSIGWNIIDASVNY